MLHDSFFLQQNLRSYQIIVETYRCTKLILYVYIKYFSNVTGVKKISGAILQKY